MLIPTPNISLWVGIGVRNLTKSGYWKWVKKSSPLLTINKTLRYGDNIQFEVTEANMVRGTVSLVRGQVNWVRGGVSDVVVMMMWRWAEVSLPYSQPVWTACR